MTHQLSRSRVFREHPWRVPGESSLGGENGLSTGKVMPAPQRASGKVGQAQSTWRVYVFSTLVCVYCFVSKTKYWALLCGLRAQLDEADNPAHMERTVSQSS